MFRHSTLGRPAETALLWKWEALPTMDRRCSWEHRENDRKEVVLLGTSTRARARVRAERLISTEPLHRRYARPAKRGSQAGTKRYVARHWGLTHSSHERRATGGRRGPNRLVKLRTRNVVNRLSAVAGPNRDRKCHRKAHWIDTRQFIREEAKAVL